MYSLKKKTYLNTCITALGLLLAIPSAYAAAPQIAYSGTTTDTPPSPGALTYTSLAQDSFGNVLLLGTASGYGTDFDPGPGVDNKGWLKGSTLFLTKQNANGSYGGTQLIGTPEPTSSAFADSGYSDVSGLSVKLDAYDNVYILGEVSTGAYWISQNIAAIVDFDPTSNIDKRAMTNTKGLFLTKLNAQGGYVSTNIIEHGISTVLDINGQSIPIPNNLTTDQLLGYDRTRNLFISKEPLAVKPDGTVYIAGLIGRGDVYNPNSALRNTFDFNPTASNDNVVIVPYPHIFETLFLTRFNPNGSYANTATIRGSTGFPVPPVISTAGQGVYIAGAVSYPGYPGTIDFNPSPTAIDEHALESGSVFVMKLDANNNYAWTRTVKRNGADNPSDGFKGPSFNVFDIVATSTDDVYVAGTFRGEADFDPSDLVVATLKSQRCTTFLCDFYYNSAFIFKLQRDGDYLWAQSLNQSLDQVIGSTNSPKGAMAVDRLGNVFVTVNTYILAENIFGKFFVSAFDANGNYGWSKYIGKNTDHSNDLLVTRNALYLAGAFGGDVDFNPDAGLDIKTGGTNIDYPAAFLSKYDLVDPVSTVTVIAKGTPVSGVYPTMVVRVDGQIAGTFTVTATNAPYVVTTPAAPGMSHSIDVVFTNDAGRPATASSPKEDRNLFVSSLRVNTTTLLPNSTGVTYDRGTGNAAFDGISVIAGQGSMWWNGALRFGVPAAAF
jgi:hypothetical protein